MRTTLDIDARLLDDVLQATELKTKNKAVEHALRMYLRWWAAKALIASAGKLDLDYDINERKRLDAEREAKLDHIRDALSERTPAEAM